ncbi:MAG: hypothetical protein JNK64_37475 [Myxococcales bacterium]|nr:hypothetical protein [Myxococcales bacterium]
MAADEGKPTATVLRIKVRHADLDAFVERFASQITRLGVFIPTRTPKPIGTEVRFEIRTADDKPALIGQGKVKLVRAHDPAHPRVVAGMAVELQRVGRDSRDVLVRMLEVRKRRGLVDGPAGMPMPGEPEHDEAREHSAPHPMPRAATPAPIAAPVAAPVDVAEPRDEVTVARAPRPRPPTAAPPPEAEPLAIAPPPAPPPAAPDLAPRVARIRPALDLSAVTAAAPPAHDDLEDWPEARRPLAEVVARARALVGDDLDAELADAAAPTPVIDLASARIAATAALGRPMRVAGARERSAPLPMPAALVETGGLAVARAADVAAVELAAPAPIVAPAVTPPPAFDDATTIDVPIAAAAAALAASPPAAAVEPPTAVDVAPFVPAPSAEAIALEAALAAEAAESAGRARAARAQRERAKREANDRALRDRNARIQRELAERERRARPPTGAPDPLAALDLDEAAPSDREATRKVDLAKVTAEATRRVDAATLAAEALGAADLRSSLAADDPDLRFLEQLALDEGPAPARRRAPHTVPRTTPPTRPPPPAPPPPGPPPPSARVDVDLADDDSVEISIDVDD